MQTIRRYSPSLQRLPQRHGEQDIRGLRLRVRKHAGVPVVRRAPERRRARRPRLLLRRHGAGLEVPVVEADGREAVAVAGDVDDARGAGPPRPRRREQLRQEQVRQQERPDVVRAELQLDLLRRPLPRRHHRARVVHQDVERGDRAADFGGRVPYGFLG